MYVAEGEAKWKFDASGQLNNHNWYQNLIGSGNTGDPSFGNPADAMITRGEPANKLWPPLGWAWGRGF